MVFPHLTIDLEKITHNTRTIVTLCKSYGISVSGVTKAVCGYPPVAAAVLRGGVESLADSRLENIHRIKSAGIASEFLLLRLPPLSAVDDVVATVDTSLNSEMSVLSGLSAAAQRRKLVHNAILMVDLGDLREGIWPADLSAFVSEAVKLKGIRLVGLGANMACYAGVVPSQENMNCLVELSTTIENQFGLSLTCISGINSSGLELIRAGQMPTKINHARIGEAILLGCETIHRLPWPGTSQDAFVLYAEILELKIKPSLPVGERSQDAFGHQIAFADQGLILRALLNVGREDIDIGGIKPLDSRIKILGATSGYLVVDMSAVSEAIKVGDSLSFGLNYSAVLAAMTSEYIKKTTINTVI